MTTRPRGMLADDVGFIATSQDALERWPTRGHTNWTAADPPRVWDMIRLENDELGWEQVKGLRALAGLLTAQAEKLNRHRDALANSWPAEESPAAASALLRIDKLILSMRRDSETALQNALALDGILTATAKAKSEVYRVVQAWETTTNSGGPEWWDREAARLSYVTEQSMTAMERAIRDHRAQLVLPPEAQRVDGTLPLPSGPKPVRVTTAGGGTQLTKGTGAGYVPTPIPAPPPLPGYPPLISQPNDGPELQGVTPPVPALPGQPVSMLPIAPGNPYAPYGGAYVLPGPGVGQSGYVVALPKPGSGAVPTVAAPLSGGNSGAPGMMPLPVGGPGQQGSRGGETYRRSADTRWDIAQGVVPIIQPAPSHHIVEPSQEETEEQFRQWFTQTAMPWRSDDTSTEPAPIVTIRRGANSS